MTQISRRRLLQLGGFAALGGAGRLILPDSVFARQPPGLQDKSPRGRWSDPDKAIASPGSAFDVAPTPVSGSPYRALDTDFGMSGVQPQSWFDAAHAEGYEGFITTLHTYWDAQPQPWLPSHEALERALTAGMWIAAYGRPDSRWREALRHLPPELRAQLKFFALDVEPEPGTNPRIHQEDTDGVANEFGVRPIIYTGWAMWGEVMGSGNTEFSHIPLWDFAGDRFDWPEEITEAPLVEYGGWNVRDNHRIGWQVQMQSPALLNGIYIDRDLFSREFIDAV